MEESAKYRYQKYRRPGLEVLEDWQTRKITQPHIKMPAAFTAEVLTCVRTQACLAAGKKGCAYWSCRHMEEDDDPNALEGHDLPKKQEDMEEAMTAVPPTPEVCEGCQSPGISMDQFSFQFFGTRAIVDSLAFEKMLKDERDDVLIKRKNQLRRLMRGTTTMNLDELFAVLVKAYVQKWLSTTQIDTFLRQCLRFLAAAPVLRAEFKKLRRQPESQIDCMRTLQSIEQEEQNQLYELYKTWIRRTEANSRLESSVKQKALDDLNEGLLQICSNKSAKRC